VLQGIVPKARGWSITSLSWWLVCDSIHRSCVTGIWLGHRSGSLWRIFTGSYSLPPSLVAIWSFITFLEMLNSCFYLKKEILYDEFLYLWSLRACHTHQNHPILSFMLLLTWKYAFSIKPYSSCKSRIYLSQCQDFGATFEKREKKK
jgi:hypothetical protein